MYVASFWLSIVVGIVSAVRVFEYTTLHLQRLIFPQYENATEDVRSYKRLAVLLLMNYVETIFWFATWYALLASHEALVITSSWPGLSVLSVRASTR